MHCQIAGALFDAAHDSIHAIQLAFACLAIINAAMSMVVI